MGSHGGLQRFLERSAEGPVFGIAAACMVSRAMQFYSFGSFSLAHALGPARMVWYDAATGAGLAVMCELLMSIAGRAWKADRRDMIEAEGRRGLSKMERTALVKHYAGSARLQFTFMLLGLAASLTAAFSFLWTGAGGTHDGGTILGDAVVTVLLVAGVFYLGVLKESRGESPAEVAQADAYSIRRNVTAAAGQRIREGKYTPQDVRIVARALPRADRERFESAMIAETADDPYWTVRQIADWLGIDSDSGRRVVARKLARLLDKGYGILKDETQKSAYQVPRSVVLRIFADDFMARRSTPTVPRQPAPASPGSNGPDTDPDRTLTEPGHPAAAVPALVLAHHLQDV